MDVQDVQDGSFFSRSSRRALTGELSADFKDHMSHFQKKSEICSPRCSYVYLNTVCAFNLGITNV